MRGLAGDSSWLWRERLDYKDEEWHVVVLAKHHKLERQKDFWRHRETWPTSQEARSLGLVQQMFHRWACTHTQTRRKVNVHLPEIHAFLSALIFLLTRKRKQSNFSWFLFVDRSWGDWQLMSTEVRPLVCCSGHITFSQHQSQMDEKRPLWILSHLCRSCYVRSM